jgi:pyridoxine 5-phosphate synthase
MAKLGVNIDHVATIRQARRTYEPDPVFAAHEAILGGADGITVHLREDRRHIQDRDLRLLRPVVPPGVKLNLEAALADEILAVALEVGPDQVTFVPEKRQEVTTEGGLNAAAMVGPLKDATARLKDAGIAVSLFIDPEPEQVETARRVGAGAVEFHTGVYAEARRPADVDRAFEALAAGLRHGRELGLSVHAGHGLNYQNVPRLAAVEGWEEFNIGHSIVSRAVFTGLRQAVREMKALCGGSRE